MRRNLFVWRERLGGAGSKIAVIQSVHPTHLVLCFPRSLPCGKQDDSKDVCSRIMVMASTSSTFDIMTSTYFCADATYRVPARWTGEQWARRLDLLCAGSSRTTAYLEHVHRITVWADEESKFAARRRINFRRARAEGWGLGLFGGHFAMPKGRTTIRRSPKTHLFPRAREGMSALGLERTPFPAPSLPSNEGPGRKDIEDPPEVKAMLSYQDDDDDEGVKHRTPLIIPI
ncbi:hypothetical protein ARMSODRAFT_1025911 [Armillaria solidipes]|uniref:Uncharacterized protein n=1 Tax=Armillaria solidipes TaxID=1076256 RepID=A0A2H3B5B0_9AGAR|nr:hypothetical protein ARMSODRAFT_1025911 [Armillaria solidipes]